MSASYVRVSSKGFTRDPALMRAEVQKSAEEVPHAVGGPPHFETSVPVCMVWDSETVTGRLHHLRGSNWVCLPGLSPRLGGGRSGVLLGRKFPTPEAAAEWFDAIGASSPSGV